jgi:hypothetical protein
VRGSIARCAAASWLPHPAARATSPCASTAAAGSVLDGTYPLPAVTRFLNIAAGFSPACDTLAAVKLTGLMGRMKSMLTVATCAAAVAFLSSSPAVAGEVTGSGKKADQNQGKSWCSFSGLNDDPGAPLDGSGPNGPGGQSQSYGQENKLGLADPSVGAV